MTVPQALIVGSVIIFTLFLIAFAFVPIPATLLLFVGFEAVFLTTSPNWYYNLFPPERPEKKDSIE